MMISFHFLRGAKMKTKNIVLVLLALLLTVLLGCERHKAKALVEKVPVQLKWRHSAQFAGFYLAEKKGFYAAENIDVSLNTRNASLSNEEVAADLVSGKRSFAVMGGDFLLAERAKGSPIVSIAVIFQRNPYVYATLKGSQIIRPRDLVGKKIMLPPDGRVQHVALMEKLGLSVDSIEYLPYDRDPNFLATGRIDAQMVYRTGSGLTLEENGLELDYIWVDDYGVRLYADNIVTTEKMIREKPDLVERFLRASLKGWRYAIENPDEAVTGVIGYDSTLAREHQMRMLQTQTPLIHTGGHQIGWMDPDVWQNMQRILKIPDDKLNISSAYTMDFLYRIYGREG
jgi:NitT/TauT family transport system substrate-binding protein